MLTNENLEIIVKKDKNVDYVQVDFIGNLDSYNLKEQKTIILQTIKDLDKKYLIFNFLNLSFLNSESISFLMQVHDLLQKDSRVLIMIEAKENVLDVLKVIGLLESIPYYSNLVEFLKTI